MRRTGATQGFSFRRALFFDGPCPFPGMGLLETMAARRDRVSTEVFGLSAEPGASRNDAVTADGAIRALARLIGRQIAREQFERTVAVERRAQKKRPAGEDV